MGNIQKNVSYLKNSAKTFGGLAIEKQNIIFIFSVANPV